MGLDPNNLSELGGEVEFWIEGEKHVFDKSTAVFIPAGVWHCPLFTHRVDKSFLFMGIGNTLRYHVNERAPGPKTPADAPLVPKIIRDELTNVSLMGNQYQVGKMFMDYVTYNMERNRKLHPKV